MRSAGAAGVGRPQFYGCGTWDVEGLAEALDELEEDESVSSRDLA
jgi:hypothetical protein